MDEKEADGEISISRALSLVHHETRYPLPRYVGGQHSLSSKINTHAPCEGANAEEEEPKVRTATAAAKKVVERSMVALVGLMLS